MKNLFTLITITIIFNAFSFNSYRNSFQTKINSKNLGYKKKIAITLPKLFDKKNPKHFPLIFVFDMQNKRSYNQILQSIDYLTSSYQMPECVVVGIESKNENELRYKETTIEVEDSTVFGIKNELFIINELLPLCKKKYKTGNFNILIGHSRYGYYTTYLLNHHPEIFNATIALDGFYKEKYNLDLTVEFPKSQIYQSNYFHFLGLYSGATFLKQHKQFTSILANNNNPNFIIDSLSFPQADHNAVPGLGVNFGLYKLFEKWHENYDEIFDSNCNSLTDMKEIILKTKNYYNSELLPNYGTINGKGWKDFNEGKFDKAIEYWTFLKELYPNSHILQFWIHLAKKELKKKQKNL